MQDRSRPYELFVAQSVLRDVRSHLIGSANNEPYGFLLGHVVYCPWTRAPYVVIDVARRETRDAPHSGEVDSFRRSWASASREARRRRGQIIGWYHQHGVLGLRLSQSDLQLQEEFFPEAWHCALLVVPGPQGVVGGFIQRTGRASLYRKGISGFYELVDLDAKLMDGKKPSVVDWTNYTAEERVEVLPAPWPARRRGPRPVRDVELETGDEPPPEAAAEAQRESASEEEPGSASRALSGPMGRRWKERPSSAKTRPATPKKPAAKGKPRSKSKRPPKAPSRKRAKPVRDEAVTATADLSEEFHEAIGPLDLEPAEAPAEGAPPPASLDVDDGQVVEFLEAIWGPQPFGPEEDDAPVMELPPREERLLREASEIRPTLDVAQSPTGPSRLNGAFAAEPPEADSGAGSLEWLLGLAEQTLGSDRAPREPEAQGTAERVAAEAGDQVAPATAERAAPDVEEPPSPEPEQPAAPETRAPAAPEAPAGYVGRHERLTFVGSSEDPEDDREAEIPVVMPTDDGFGRLRLLRRRGRALIAAAMAVLAVSAWLLLRGEEPPQPAFQTPAPGAPPVARAPGQAPEFIRLSAEFTAALAAYRERHADFQLGRIDCTGLGTGYAALGSAFSAVSEYVALAPAGSVDFRPLADGMREARVDFEGSGCEGAAGTTAGPGP